MNSKVIFYGNCQLGELSIRLRHSVGFSDYFEIVLPENCGRHLHDESAYLFAKFLFFISKEKRPRPEILNLAFSGADVAFLHHVSPDFFGEEYSSAAICAKYPLCKKIFVTNFWFDPYCQVDEIIANLFKSGIREPLEILNFMLHEYDPFIKKSVLEKYENQIRNLEVREGEYLKFADENISLLDFIKRSWTKQSLCENRPSHPAPSVSCFLQEEAFRILKLPVLRETFAKISSRRAGSVRLRAVRINHPFVLTELRYFGIIFPDIFESIVSSNNTGESKASVREQIQYIKNKILEIEKAAICEAGI